MVREILQVPPPRHVALDPEQTALLVMDVCDPLCLKRPSCIESVPAVERLLAKTRESGALVVHTLPPRSSTPLESVTPEGDERVLSAPADKFFETELEGLLEENGVTTVILVGTSANGAVMYTAFAASMRGLAVVVAEDAISADETWTVEFVKWQLLHQPGMNNDRNEAPQNRRATLSTVDQIEFA